jgi:hypothetical protein
MHTRTTPLSPVDLADPIWTIEHVALAFRLGVRATRSLIARPDFPGAFRLSDARTARLYWRREQVLDFVAGGATTGATQATSAPLAPRSTVTAGRPAPATGPLDAESPRYVGTDDDALAAMAALRAAQAVAA